MSIILLKISVRFFVIDILMENTPKIFSKGFFSETFHLFPEIIASRFLLLFAFPDEL